MSPQRFGTWLAIRLARILRRIPRDDGRSEFQSDDPHDPQVATRLQFDDDFRIFERKKP